MNAIETLTALVFFLREDLFDCGRHPEDGSQLTGLAWSVVCQAPDGRQWAHAKTWTKVHCGDCIAHYSFSDPGDDSEEARAEWDKGCGKDHSQDSTPREVATAEADLLMAKIKLAIVRKQWKGPIGNRHWSVMEPVYGSEAYASGGYEVQRLIQELKDENIPMSEWPLAAMAAAE